MSDLRKFIVEAVDGKGNKVRREISAADRDEAMVKAKAMGLFPTRVKERRDGEELELDAPGSPLLERIKRIAIGVVVLTVVVAVVLVSAWNSVFHYVRPGQMLVIISKSGDDPPSGELLAGPGQKGPLREVRGEGRHFVLPVLYDVEVIDLESKNMKIPPGMIGVVTAKIGKDLPPGRILAEPDEKGIQRAILPPGWHRLNPYGYSVEVRPATVITPGFVGFVTSLVGNEPKGPFAGPGEKGVRRDVLQPGLYYLNPYEVSVREVEVGMNQVSFLGHDQIAFPSSDAFDIRLDATVEWELHPQNVPLVMAEFGARQEIEDKVLIAQSRSIGRLEGSRWGAKDFLLGEGRRHIQDAFTSKLLEKCKEKHVTVHSAYIRHISIPQPLLEPIRESFVAAEIERTAKVQEDTRKGKGALQREQSMITQRRQEVHAETEALVQRLRAEGDRGVAEIQATTRRLVAEKQQEIARLEAQRTKLLGEAQAQVQRMLGEARAGLFALKVAAFRGDSDAFARYTFALSLPEDLQVRLVQTGPGTFWTDLESSAGSGMGPMLGSMVDEQRRREAAAGDGKPRPPTQPAQQPQGQPRPGGQR